jgi:hypothetical protein
MRPRAFRIRDFKSIRDSGVCNLSGDNITVLAGQNEAGKTAILTALRDFDLESGEDPETADYEPDDERQDSAPSVSVQFDSNPKALLAALSSEDLHIPASAKNHLERNTTFWITRNLRLGQYVLDPEFAAAWGAQKDIGGEAQAESGQLANAQQKPEPELDAEEFADWLRNHWPIFVYFDSFQDFLPRQVDFSVLKPPKVTAPPQTTPGAAKTPSPKPPAAVKDFITLADLDLERIARLAENDKSLGNYLHSRSAAITGDFLTYWKQKADSDETVEIRVKAIGSALGALKLAFYVHDKSDQFPDQRSKGFLWFLSFYLKLAAAKKSDPQRNRLLLIDEPGSYLHARAQRDVLHLFESRIADSSAILYSTHSPYLMPSDRMHRLRIVLKTTASGTKILDRLTHPALRGEKHADSLSPVIAAIGLDISQSITFNKKRNLFVEGISDLMYLSTWASMLRMDFNENFNIFPGSSATTIPTLASLFIGWGFKFVTLLDNDQQGKSTRDKLMRQLLVPEARIVQPRDAKTIEDLLSPEDFRGLLHAMDKSLTLNTAETPAAAISRQSVDKVLLARVFSEEAARDRIVLTKKSHDRIGGLLETISGAWEK